MCALARGLAAHFSETFIRRHVEDLLPGRTVVVAQRLSHPVGGGWEPPCPVLFLGRFDLNLGVRLARRARVASRELRARAVRRFLRAHKVSMALGEYLDNCIEFVPPAGWDGPSLCRPRPWRGCQRFSALTRDGENYLAYSSAKAVLTRCEFHRRHLIDLGLPAGTVHVNPGGVEDPRRIRRSDPGFPARRGAEAVGRNMRFGHRQFSYNFT